MNYDAETIVRALAAADEPLDGDVSPSCTLCDYVYYIGIHDKDCPWRMAREWVADNRHLGQGVADG